MKSCFDTIIKPRSLEKLLIKFDSVKGNLRTINKSDENLSLIPILFIQYKGSGSSRTLEDIRFATADIGRVTETTADIAVRSDNGKITPYKIKTEFGQYLIVYKNVSATKEKFELL